MKSKNFISVAAIIICLMCFGCSKGIEEGKVVARVNDYVMSVEDLEDEIAHSPYASDKSKDLEDLLELAIRRQVLIQEAQRQGLDRNESFMKTIERYWEQTLIKELMEKETCRIYDEVGRRKQDEAVNQWMEGLYNSANIKINNEVLEELKKRRQ